MDVATYLPLECFQPFLGKTGVVNWLYQTEGEFFWKGAKNLISHLDKC